MDHRHAVFDRDALTAGCLDIDIASRQAGQNQRLLAVHDMTTIEFCVDRHGQLQTPHRLLHDFLIRDRRDEVSTKGDEHVGLAVNHRLQGIHHRPPMMLRRPKAEHFLDLAEQFRARLLVNADGSVTLHVGMAAHGADAGAGPAKIAAHHKEIGDLLHIHGTVTVLGEAHAVADDDRFGPHVDLGNPVDLRSRQSRDAQDGVPGCASQIVRERVEAGRVLLDEGKIEHRFAAHPNGLVVRLENQLHHAFQDRNVTADTDLAIFAGDPGRAECCDLDRILRCSEPFQCALQQRIHSHNRNPAPRGLPQAGHHSWTVGAGVLPNHEDCVSCVEILQ
jgi:hypothetical protein